MSSVGRAATRTLFPRVVRGKDLPPSRFAKRCANLAHTICIAPTLVGNLLSSQDDSHDSPGHYYYTVQLSRVPSPFAAQPFVAADAANAARVPAGFSRRVYGCKGDSAFSAAPLNSTVGPLVAATTRQIFNRPSQSADRSILRWLEAKNIHQRS